MPETWISYVSDYIEVLTAAGQSARTIKLRITQLRCLAVETAKSPLEVTLDDVVHVMSSHDWKQETRRGFRNAASRFFYWMAATGRRDNDIARGLPAVRHSKALPHPCPDEVIFRALSKADETETRLIRLGAECGLRREEMTLVFPQNDIVEDLLGYSLLVHGKGRVERYVPMPDDLAAELQGIDGWLFPGRFGGHIEVGYVGNHLTPLLEGHTPHSLRHRFATVTWEATHDILLVSKLLGHDDVRTTMRYIFVGNADLRRGVSAVTLPPHEFVRTN